MKKDFSCSPILFKAKFLHQPTEASEISDGMRVTGAPCRRAIVSSRRRAVVMRRWMIAPKTPPGFVPPKGDRSTQRRRDAENPNGMPFRPLRLPALREKTDGD